MIHVLVIGAFAIIAGVVMLANLRNLRREFGSSTQTTRVEANVVRTTGGTGTATPFQWRQESPYQIFHPAEPLDRTAQMIAEQDQRYEAWRNSRARLIDEADEADLELDPATLPVPEFEDRGDIPDTPIADDLTEDLLRLRDRYEAMNRRPPPPGNDPF
jgi:hypothetical protein